MSLGNLFPLSDGDIAPTKENPADLVSRGVKGSVLKNSKEWWEGPEFLKENPKNWPNNEKFKKPDSEKLSDIDS